MVTGSERNAEEGLGGRVRSWKIFPFSPAACQL